MSCWERAGLGRHNPSSGLPGHQRGTNQHLLNLLPAPAWPAVSDGTVALKTAVLESCCPSLHPPAPVLPPTSGAAVPKMRYPQAQQLQGIVGISRHCPGSLILLLSTPWSAALLCAPDAACFCRDPQPNW